MNISSRTKGVLMAVIGSIFWGGSGVAAQFIREFDTSKRKKHLSALVNIAVSLSNFSF